MNNNKIYEIQKDKIIIKDLSQFNAEHILECGQIFSYKKNDDSYMVFSEDKVAKITENNKNIEIKSQNIDYFVNFFDLNTDYSKIKAKLKNFDCLKEPIKFGYGIRILNQNVFETIISFIVSANNNIKRIQKILFAIRQKYGTKIDDYFAFPTKEQLANATEEELLKLGAGYRAKYICKTAKLLLNEDVNLWQCLSTNALKQKLLSLCGVGPKVADCILLFAFHRGDSFPVDTWIEKMYNQNFNQQNLTISRHKMSENLVKTFGANSGYAQQYLFYYQRSFLKK